MGGKLNRGISVIHWYVVQYNAFSPWEADGSLLVWM